MGIFNFGKRAIVNTQFIVTGGSPGYQYQINKHPVALACIDLISGAVSSLPFDLYRKRDNGSREKVRDHTIARILRRPNLTTPSYLFYYQMVVDYFNGNFYAYKYRTGSNVTALLRIDPSTIEPVRSGASIVYQASDRTYSADEILHIPSRFGFNGLKGQSIFDYYRSAFDLAIAMDNYFRATMDNSFGVDKKIILDISELLNTARLTREQIEDVKAKFINDFAGVLNSGKPIIKSVQGVKYESLDVGGKSNRENQLNENLQVVQELIAKVFNVPTSLLHGENKYNGLESLYTIFIDFAVRPIAEAFVDGFESLLTLSELDYLYVEPNYNALLKLDTSAKIDAYTKEIGSGILTINEARARENLPTIGPAGDVPHLPANLLPVDEETIAARIATQKLALQQLEQDKTGEY